MLALSYNHKFTMGLDTGANNLNQYSIKIKCQNMKDKMHLQVLPTLWSSIQPHHKGVQTPPTRYTHKGFVGHYSDLTLPIPYHKL